MQSETVSLIIILVCIVMSAYFSATETAFSSLNRIKIRNLAEKGNKKAALVEKLSDNYDSLLSTILIGNNIVNIASASLATVLFVELLGNEAGPSVSTVVTTIVVLIFGEVSPKSIAKEAPEKFAMFSAPFLNTLVFLLTPFNYLFKQWKKLLSAIFKTTEEDSITGEELLIMVEEATQEGGIDEQESTLIRSAIEFSDLEAQDILTPRVDIVGVSEDMSVEKIAGLFAETGYSRLPLYETDLDHIVGIIYHKDFYNQVYHQKKEIRSIIRPALFISKTRKIDGLLKELQQKKSHIAVVVDEFGGTVGIVTLEDILEELVGDIWDEHDEVIKEIEKISDGEYLVRGSASLDKFFDLVQIREDVEVVTVSGWIMHRLERVPKENDSFTYQGVNVTVLAMDGNRVDTVRIKTDSHAEENAEL